MPNKKRSIQTRISNTKKLKSSDVNSPDIRKCVDTTIYEEITTVFDTKGTPHHISPAKTVPFKFRDVLA